MDAAVQLLSAASISTQLISDPGNPPGAGGVGTWSSTGFYVQTRPTSVAATLMMCTLVNNLGVEAIGVTVSYDFAMVAVLAEQVAGHRAYYSLTGAAGSWTLIPAFTGAPVGRVSTNLNVTIPNGGTLYIVWADDNADVSSPDTAMQIDNFSAIAIPGIQTPVTITAEPQNQNVAELQPASFTVGISGYLPPTVQWYTNNVAIANATNTTYSIASAPLHYNGLNFKAIAQNVANSTTYFATSQVATLTVNADNVAPVLLGAQAAGVGQVVAAFSERLALNSATNVSHYSVTGLMGALTISNAVLDASMTNVILTVSPMTPGSSYTLIVNGVTDPSAAANPVAANSTASFSAAALAYVDIGSPAIGGTIVTAGNGYNISGAGTNILGAADQFTFAYQPFAGDFDVKVRILSLSPTHPLARAGLMARESLTTNSRFAATLTGPNVAGSFFESRLTASAAATVSGYFPVNFPYTWLRLRRQGDVFTGYGSFDGQDWVQLGTSTLASSPASIYLGYAISSANASAAATVAVQDYQSAAGGNVVSFTSTREPLGPSSRRGPLVISEIMYHPKDRPDGRQLEFIEIYNSQPYFEDMSGYRLSGDVDFTFPPNTILQGGGFLVLAKVAADVQAVYGISGVLNYGLTQYTTNISGNVTNIATNIVNSLDNGSGQLRLHGRAGNVLLDLEFRSQYPWPIEADGAGHSLVLARPSYGEGSRLAWAASDRIGGSPGEFDGIGPEPGRNVVINEFLAHTDLPQEDVIELYNHGNTPVDISGFWLTDSLSTNKYRIQDGTTLPARGFVAFIQSQLGFALTAAGEQILLVNSNQTRVIDAVGFDGQENGVSFGRYPDGAPGFQRLSAFTPQTANAAPRTSPVVINEIMYNPISGNGDDEFVELYNRSGSPVNIGNWSFTSGIDYTFPIGTMIPPGGYVVVAKNTTRMLENGYGNLGPTNLFGNYNGSLANSGERLALGAPDYMVVTNGSGQVFTNVEFHFVVNEVTYGQGGRWGNWADGGGSSLELIDPLSDQSLAANWGDSDETAKSLWTSVEATGNIDDEWPANTVYRDNIHVYMLGVGECLVDDVEVRPGGTNNVMINGGFESGIGSWVVQGSHDQSFIENTGYAGTKSLHLMAASRGDPGANRVRSGTGSSFTTALVLNTPVTLRAKARWLRGFPELLLRLHGGGMEAAGRLPVPRNLGTPGAQNSQFRTNNGPAIYDVVHSPILPAANEAIVVTTRVNDPNGISSLVVRYRVDPLQTFISSNMVDNGTGGDAVAGDGLYSATIPGQASGTRVAFHIQAVDGTGVTNLFPANALVRQFPIDSPKRECIVRWGEVQMPGSYATYHMWITQETQDRWVARPRLSNAGLDATFVYNNTRVIYNMSPQYAGSVWHVGSMDGPTASDRVDFVMNFPTDDLMLGQTDFVLNTVGNPDPGNAWGMTDHAAMTEQTSYEIFKAINVHYNYRRYIHLFINGDQRSRRNDNLSTFIMEDSQQPNGDVVKEWWPDDTEGQLYKIEDRFEYNDAGDSHGGNEGNAQLVRQMSSYNGVNQLKMAHYRFMFRKRSVGAADSASDYTNLFTLIDIVSPTNNPSITPLPDPIVKQALQVADLEQWMRIFAVQHTVGNWDSYGYRRGKNAYTYRPNFGKFGQMTWDIDFTMGVGGDGTGQSLFDTGGGKEPRIDAMFNSPEIRRMYWRAFQDIINGPLNNSYLDPLLDARAAAHAANGVNYDPSFITTIKSYISGRRSTIAGQIPSAAFNISSSTNFTSGSNYVTLTGTAPIDLKFIEINGVSYPITWTTETAWSLRLPMSVSGVNNFMVQGLNRLSNAVPNALRPVTVNYTGTIELPQTNIVFNEIMYNPLTPDAEYVELFNRSTNFTFDLSGWRINGLDYIFPEGATMGPRAFLVLVKDRVAYGNAYGGLAPAFDQYPGNLQVDGETLTLIRPGLTPEEDIVVDKVRYEFAPPWPATETQYAGSSFQLIDPAQDNSRVGNWYSIAVPPQYSDPISTPATPRDGWRFFSASGSIGTGDGGGQMRLLIYLDTAGSALIDDLSIVAGTNAEVGYNYVANGDFESPLTDGLTNSWRIGTNCYGDTLIVNDLVHAGTGAFKIIGTNASGAANPPTYNRAIFQWLSPAPPANSTNTLSFWYWATNSAQNLLIRIRNSAALTTGGTGTNINIFITPSNYIAAMKIADGTNSLTPGTANNNTVILPEFQNLWINEVQADNFSGILDSASQHEPWVEIYNAGTNTVSLDGLYLSPSYANLTNWAFPAGHSLTGGQFLVVFCDGDPEQTTGSELHTSFELPSSSGSIALSRLYNNAPQVLDYLNYNGLHADYSYGSFPDGQPFDRQEFFYVTPSGTNNGTSGPLVVFINEWMAGNASYLADPADFNYEDWFELYNPATNAVDLAGYWLSDSGTNGGGVVTNKFKFLITTNMAHIIPPQGYLLVWADNETGQNLSGGVPRPDMHANFALSLGGEAIGLFAADGTQIDWVTFGQQTNDVSQGRFPDGGPNIYWFVTNRTPRAANFIPGLGNNAPVLGVIGNKSLYVGQTLSFTATATDADVGQTLSYTLGAGAPLGASIGLASGAFTWTPNTATTNFITVRVTDNGVPQASDSETIIVRVSNRPEFGTTSLNGPELTLGWFGTQGSRYRVVYKDDLNDPMWHDYSPILEAATDGPLSVTDFITNSAARFFQLKIVP